MERSSSLKQAFKQLNKILATTQVQAKIDLKVTFTCISHKCVRKSFRQLLFWTIDLFYAVLSIRREIFLLTLSSFYKSDTHQQVATFVVS